uniref:Keratinocyte differentiation associated protein n=1 Tax=Felis catus TaxID=9685 RepID=A0ABI7YQ61_FELCA
LGLPGRSRLFSTLCTCCLPRVQAWAVAPRPRHSPIPSRRLAHLSAICLTGTEQEETTIGDYAAGPENFNAQFLNIDKLRAAFKPDEFLNWHALFESIKRKLPFLNWDAFPKLKGLRSATPDAQ